MAALEDVLGLYDQSNFDIGSTAALIRQLGKQAGLSEEELAAAVPVFGDAHRAAYNSGYTEGSNYSAIAQRAVSDALAARGADPSRFNQATQGFVDQGAQQANQRWQATQEKDSGGLLGDLGPLAKIAALFPGPQQPFLLAANAANSLSQGDLIGAGTNALGAYSGFSGGYNPGAGGENALSAQEFAANAGPAYTGGNMAGEFDFGDYQSFPTSSPDYTDLGDYQSFPSSSPSYTDLGDYQSFPAPAPSGGYAPGAGGEGALSADEFAANAGVGAPGGSGLGMLQKLMAATGLSEKQLMGLGAAGISSLTSLYGASQIGKAATTAANIGAGAADRATQLQTQMYQDQLSRSQPFYQAGVNALGPYTKSIMGSSEDQAAGRFGSLVRPFDVNKDYIQSPYYQVSLDKKLKDYTNKLASMGLVDSGPMRRGVLGIAGQAGQEDITNAYNRYNQDLGTQRNALGNLAGYGPPATAVQNAASSNYATNVGNLGMNAAGNQANAGLTAAQANQSAYGNVGNAFANYLAPNPMNTFFQNQLNRQLPG